MRAANSSGETIAECSEFLEIKRDKSIDGINPFKRRYQDTRDYIYLVR